MVRARIKHLQRYQQQHVQKRQAPNNISENSFEEKIDITKHIYPPVFVDKFSLAEQRECPCAVSQEPGHDDRAVHTNQQSPEHYVDYFIDQPIYPPVFLETNGDHNQSVFQLPKAHSNDCGQIDNSKETTDDPPKETFYFQDAPGPVPAVAKGEKENRHKPKCDAFYPNAVSNCTAERHPHFGASVCMDNFVFGLVNIRKMDLILNQSCDLALQIDYADFMYPIVIVDQNEKTNKDIPFIHSVNSFLFQLQKRNKSMVIFQFFIDGCCFSFVFRVQNICYIQNYQVTLFVRTISNLKDLEKIIHKNRCDPKVTAHCVVGSFYVDEGKISFPKDPIRCQRKAQPGDDHRPNE